MNADHLKQVPLFAGLGKRERKALAQQADEIDVPEGRALACEGDWAHEFFLIEKGTASVTRGGEHIGDLGPGDYFGEIGIVRKQQRTATVTATSDMEVVVLTPQVLNAIRLEQPEVAESIRSEVESRLGPEQASSA